MARPCCSPRNLLYCFWLTFTFKINPHDKVLVRGATSGVGIAFLKLLKGKFPHIEITGTSRKVHKNNALLAAGFSEVILDQDKKLQTLKKYNKILELIGPATIKDSFQHLLPGGIICSTGQLGGQWYLEDFDPIFDTNGGYLTGFPSSEVDQAKMTALFDFITTYQIPVSPEKIFSLKDTPKAHAYLESAHSFGKVVVVNA